MNCSTPGLPVHHQLPEFTQTHVHRVVMPSNHLILCRPFSFINTIILPERTSKPDKEIHKGQQQNILTDIQYISKQNKVSLCEKNRDINRKTEEAPERTQLTINYLLFAGTETDSS